MKFIDEHRNRFGGVEPIRRVLRQHGCQIAPSGYWAAKARQPSLRQRRDEQLLTLIREIHAANYGVYGARKVWHELHRRGQRVARCTVERLMCQAGLSGVVRGRKVRTTVGDPGHQRAGDLVNRDFTAVRPNRTWVADFTHVATWSRRGLRGVRRRRVLPRHRRLVGRHQQAHPAGAGRSRHGVVAARSRRPTSQRRPRASQRRWQYTSFRFTTHLLDTGIDASIGSVGDALDC